MSEISDLLEMARNLRPYIEQAAQSLPDADGTITLHYLPHELVGMYFEEVAG